MFTVLRTKFSPRNLNICKFEEALFIHLCTYGYCISNYFVFRRTEQNIYFIGQVQVYIVKYYMIYIIKHLSRPLFLSPSLCCTCPMKYMFCTVLKISDLKPSM